MRLLCVVPVRCALLAALILLLIQAAIVHARFNGDWSALFTTGDATVQSPAVAAEHPRLIPGVSGYDGQFYHALAHDPLLRHGVVSYLDQPRLRARRILVPLLAYLLAFGQDRWIDAAYRLEILFWCAVGAYWTSLIAVRAMLCPWFGLLFLIVPASLTSADRMTVDIAVAALCAGCVRHKDGRGPALWLILAAAALSRETGMILAAAFSVALLFQRKSRDAMLCGITLVPAAAWYFYVLFRTPPLQSSAANWPLTFPFGGLWSQIVSPVQYSLSSPALTATQVLDTFSLAGVFLAIALAVWIGVRKPTQPITIGLLLYTVLAAYLATLAFPLAGKYWSSVYSFGRSLSPLLFLLALEAFAAKRLIFAVPLLLAAVRVLWAMCLDIGAKSI